jgi:hypothetical protein
MTTDEPTAKTPRTGTASAAHDAATPDQTPDPSDLSMTFTPRQILGGFALLAGLVMLLRRKRRDPDRGERD